MFGIFTGIAAAVTGVVSTVATFASTVGGSIVAGATALVAKVPNLILVKDVLETVAKVVVTIGEILGILKPEDDNMEELGAKALQEGTRPKAEDESTIEYLNYLKDEIELDKQKFEKLSESEKLACSAVGSTIVSKAISEKMSIEISPEFLLAVSKTNMEINEAFKYIATFSNKGFTTMDTFTSYLDNSLKQDKVQAVDSTMVEALKEVHPTLTDAEIREKIIETKINYNQN